MESRVAVAAGLAGGVAAGVLLIAAIVALAPDPGASEATLPPPAASAPPSAATPSAAPPDPSSSPGASASAGALVTAFHIGDPAPPLVVPQVGGGTIDLAELAGKPVWVNFMGTYCPECVDEFPRMNGFAVRYAEDGLVVVAVDVRQEEAVVAAFARSLEATFPIGLDLDGSAAREWDALALPVHFWIDAEGIVRDGALGGIGPDIMARGVGRILPGVEVTP